MFKKKNTETSGQHKIQTESALLDGLCELAVERHFQHYIKTASKYRMSMDSNDQITTHICEALVKDLENEIWQRIAPKMVERVDKMKKLALEATGSHRRV